MNVIDKYVKLAVDIANDNKHGYAQDNRNGVPDYDCSSLVIKCVKNAGIKVDALYTGDMLDGFLKAGFVKVKLDKKTLVKGDILLTPYKHTAIYVGDGKLVEASGNEKGTATNGKPGDQTGKEIWVHDYYNYPWTYVLRYSPKSNEKTNTKTDSKTNTKSNNTINKSNKSDKAAVKNITAKDKAQRFDKSLSAKFKTTANLNMRHGAGVNKSLIITVPKGKTVRCWGYYNYLDCKWLYVEYTENNVCYTGFMCNKWLSKM